MEMNIRTKIDINIVCTCGNPLTIIYHKHWYGKDAIGVDLCTECFRNNYVVNKNNKEKSSLTNGDTYDTIPKKEKDKDKE